MSEPEVPEASEDESAAPSMNSLAVRGATFEIAGFGVGQVIRLGSNLLLTRWLIPEHFGLSALVAIVMTGLEMFSDVGLQQVVIQSPRGEDRRFLDTAWTIQVLRGALIWLVAVAISGPVAVFYGEPQLRDLLIVGSLTALIRGFQSTGLFLQRRRVELGAIAALELVVQVTNILVMIAWAYQSPTVWALVVGGLVSSVVWSIGTYLLPVRGRNWFGWDRTAASSILRFGVWIFASSLVFFVGSRGDRLLLGKLIDVGTLGVYSIAVMLSELVVMVIERINGGVFYPLFSRASREGEDELKDAYFKARLWIDILALPGVGLLMAIAQPLVEFLWDDRYADAGWMLEILCVRIGMSSVLACSETSLTATGRPQYGFGRSAMRTTWVIGATILGFQWYGLPGIVWAAALVEVPALLVILPGLHRIGILSPLRELRSIAVVVGSYFGFRALVLALGIA